MLLLVRKTRTLRLSERVKRGSCGEPAVTRPPRTILLSANNAAPPPAEGVRVHWDGLPSRIRAAIEGWLGSPVISAVTQPGGFSPGLAARLQAADGRRVFAKAVGPELNPDAPRFHRREGRIVAALPSSAPVPRLLWLYDEGSTEAADGWVVLVFEDIEGRHPTLPWRLDELDRVLDALDALAVSLTPSPLPAEITVTRQGVAQAARAWLAATADGGAGRSELGATRGRRGTRRRLPTWKRRRQRRPMVTRCSTSTPAPTTCC